MFELGADPNIHDKEGLEPIRDIFAYATDVEWKIERMRLYLEAGAAPDSASRHGESSHLADELEDLEDQGC